MVLAHPAAINAASRKAIVAAGLTSSKFSRQLPVPMCSADLVVEICHLDKATSVHKRKLC
jgi:hypothetical protein